MVIGCLRFTFISTRGTRCARARAAYPHFTHRTQLFCYLLLVLWCTTSSPGIESSSCLPASSRCGRAAHATHTGAVGPLRVSIPTILVCVCLLGAILSQAPRLEPHYPARTVFSSQLHTRSYYTRLRGLDTARPLPVKLPRRFYLLRALVYHLPHHARAPAAHHATTARTTCRTQSGHTPRGPIGISGSGVAGRVVGGTSSPLYTRTPGVCPAHTHAA